MPKDPSKASSVLWLQARRTSRAEERVGVMRVRVTRSGGVTGVILDGELDTATLAAAERTDVERILARLEGADSGKPPQAADRFQYDVTIATEDDTRRLTLNESDVPAELGELLTTIAQRRPPSVDRSTEGPE